MTISWKGVECLERKAIQICAADMGTKRGSFLALCDDGSIWIYYRLDELKGSWERLEDVPGSTEETTQ
jgi:hypothetical protein